MDGNSVTLEDMEQASKEAEAPAAPVKASDVKLDFTDLPDGLKGKQLTDVLADLENTRKALKLSEDARLALARSGERPPVAEEQQPVKRLSRDELKELMQEDPLAAYEYMQSTIVATLDDHLSNRFDPLVSGTIAAVERGAREKYKAEFELFGEQITEAKKRVDPRILATDEGWDDVMAYIRGRPGNFEKIIEHRSKSNATAAREEQASNTGFSASRSSVREAPSSGGDFGLDDVQKEIARNLHPNLSPEKAYAEYKKWM